jgi:site-specific DNA-methyltransferase (adenine-specific)
MYKNVELFCGDCLEQMKHLPDGSIDLILTDPPYKIVSGGCTNKGGGATSGILSRTADEVRKGTLFKHNSITFAEWLPEVFRVLKKDSHCYIMINGRNLSELQAECEKVGFKYQNLLVWNKGNLTPNKWYMNQCEFILMLRKGKAKNIRNMGTSTLINIPNIIGKKVHPTEKPTALMELLITNSTDDGETVLDPFMGSGKTGVACINTGRKFIGIELDKQYFEIAEKKIADKKKVGKVRES